MVSSHESTQPSRRRAPATTPEARENRLIAATLDLVERQISEGTASSQVLTHYLKQSTTRNRLEERKLEMEIEMHRVKIEDMQRMQQSEEMYKNALDAMRAYQGQDDAPDD